MKLTLEDRLVAARMARQLRHDHGGEPPPIDADGRAAIEAHAGTIPMFDRPERQRDAAIALHAVHLARSLATIEFVEALAKTEGVEIPTAHQAEIDNRRGE